jgi:hypothetical protein
MQSQQIRGALPRSVTKLSSRYPQLLCVFSHFQPRNAFRAAKIPARRQQSRHRIAASGLTVAKRAGAFCIVPEPRAPLRPSSSIQNHYAGCNSAGDSPLSGVVACCPPRGMGSAMDGLFEMRGGGAMCAQASRC